MNTTKQQLVDYLHSAITKRGFTSDGYKFIKLPHESKITNGLNFGYIQGQNIDIALCTYTTDEKPDADDAVYIRYAIMLERGTNKHLAVISF